MSTPGPGNALDHVVVVMFENRSFDNLLGRLYEPGEVASFEGVIGKELSNPIPEWAEDAARGSVAYGIAPTMDTPNPDPGEELPHINTQLFNVLDERNRGVLIPDQYFNTPEHPDRPTMDGFVTDYISMLMGELGRPPRYDEYSKIMTGYTPEQMPVLSTLARGFATFDHWFCDVPTCTFPNRSFFHAGTSAGYVVNTTPADAFPLHNTGETLFNRLDAAGRTSEMLGSLALGPGKPEHIFARTGRLPVFAGGNADVDIEMLACAKFAILIKHDDADREFAYTKAAEKSLSASQEQGWTVVSVKDDWATVFSADLDKKRS